MKATYFPEEEICKKYLNGKNTYELALEYNTYNTSIRRVLIRNGVKVRGNSESRVLFNHNPFEELDNKVVQYWLGILMSDGNVFKTRVLLSLKDIEHLRKYCDFLGIPHNHVKSYKNNRLNILEYYVAFKNKAVAKYLTSIGITANKSKSLEIRFPITWDVLRGIIDGDGYYRKYKNGRVAIEIATASHAFKNQITDFLVRQEIHCTVREVKGIFIIGIYKDSLLMIKRLFNNAHVFLQRKYDKIGHLL